MASRAKITGLTTVVILLAAAAASAQDARSPAACNPLDKPETGIQGDVPMADQQSGRSAEGYNCGLALLSEVSLSGTGVQGAGHCAYVRVNGGMTRGTVPDPSVEIHVIDLSDPTAPRDVRTLQPMSSSETMRTFVDGERAILVNGRAVYDIRDCENPVQKGDIAWPGVGVWPAGGYHDVRISHDGKTVYAGIYAIEADISNLDDPNTWTIRNHSCAIAGQESGNPDQIQTCQDDAYELGSGGQQYSHGPDENGDGTRIYLGNQGAPPSSESVLRILDRTVSPARVVSATGPDNPGHSIDWFQKADGREFLLHANELDTGDTCQPHPRSANLGWAYQAYLTNITNELAPTRASMVEIAINEPEHCAERQASGHAPWIAYHSIDTPYDPHFAMISFGTAGIRVFNIIDPYAPTEVAYYNKGSVAHDGVSWYDAARGLILIPSDGLKVLEIEPQVFDTLGMPRPTDPAYPRFLPEPGFALSLVSGLVLLAAVRRRSSTA